VRLVLDTNVVLSGLLWRGYPRQLLDLAKQGTVSLYTSGALLDELADVLSREKWVAMLTTKQTRAAFLMQRYGALAKVVRPNDIGRVAPNDPDDDAVIACALAAGADLIVSGDRHLHSLGGDYNGIPIVTPAQAVQKITG
jgi:putative PIN family toxin of toxin-antitoxin system